MTSPEATLLLDCIVTAPNVRPAPVIEVVAAAWVMPTTLGTETIEVPPEPPPPPPQPEAISSVEMAMILAMLIA
jgi:hypothetical protein